MLSHPSPLTVDGARHLSMTLSHMVDNLVSYNNNNEMIFRQRYK